MRLALLGSDPCREYTVFSHFKLYTIEWEKLCIFGYAIVTLSIIINIIHYFINNPILLFPNGESQIVHMFFLSFFEQITRYN